MGRKEVFIGLFVILVILGITFGIKKAKDSKVQPLEIPIQVETRELENKFKLSIPGGVEKISLRATEGNEGMGIATRNEILADLPDLPSGQYYQGWLKNSSGKTILLGKLEKAKGGYLLEFSSEKNYFDYKKVEVRLGENIILSGSF